MKNFQIFTFTLLSLLSASALAAGQVKLKVVLTPAGSFVAEDDKISGNVYKDGAGYAGQNISLHIDDFKTGIELRDEHMNKKYFESDKFPTATLKSAKGQDGKFTGDLEVHGQTKPVSGTYKIDGGNLVAEFSALMSDYQIPKAIYMGLGVKDKIEVVAQIPVGEAPKAAAPVAPAPKAAATPAPKAAPKAKKKK